MLASEDTLARSSPESLIQDNWRNLPERPVVSDRVCTVVVDETHCVSNGALELTTVSDINCTFSTLLEPIQGDVSPDGEKVIAIKIPNCAKKYIKNDKAVMVSLRNTA